MYTKNCLYFCWIYIKIESYLTNKFSSKNSQLLSHIFWAHYLSYPLPRLRHQPFFSFYVFVLFFFFFFSSSLFHLYTPPQSSLPNHPTTHPISFHLSQLLCVLWIVDCPDCPSVVVVMPVSPSVDQSIGRLVGWLVSWLLSWLVGWMLSLDQFIQPIVLNNRVRFFLSRLLFLFICVLLLLLDRWWRHKQSSFLFFFFLFVLPFLIKYYAWKDGGKNQKKKGKNEKENLTHQCLHSSTGN